MKFRNRDRRIRALGEGGGRRRGRGGAIPLRAEVMMEVRKKVALLDERGGLFDENIAVMGVGVARIWVCRVGVGGPRN